MSEQWVVLTAGDDIRPEDMPEIVGPFTSRDDAIQWAIVNPAYVSTVVAVIPTGDGMTDAEALEAIREMLRDPEWGVGMLEDIAQLVTATGRDVQNYPDNRSTWQRH